MYIVTIEVVREDTVKNWIGMEKEITIERTIFHQECEELDLVRVIAAVNEIGSEK